METSPSKFRSPPPKPPRRRYSDQLSVSTSGSTTADDHNNVFNSLNTSSELQNKYLLEEIKALKEINDKLWEYLCTTQACLEKLQSHSQNSMAPLSVSDFLANLYYSLKAKDSAMENRMKVILEERCTALQDLEEMIQVLARSFKDDPVQDEMDSNMEIREILKRIEITNNPSELLQQQRLLLMHIYHSKELKQDHLVHELKLAISERNCMLEKVSQLEEEIKNLKLSNEIRNLDIMHWEKSLLMLLSQIIQQRDDTSKTADHKNLDLKTVKIRKTHAFNDLQKLDQVCLRSTSDETGPLKEQIGVLNKALEMETKKRENAEEKCLRLEKLLVVLQKKIDGQNVGISV